MTGERVEALRGVYRAWEQGDFAAWFGLLEENAILVVDPEIPEGGAYVGVEEISSYTRKFLEPWESMSMAAESFTGSGDSVLVAVKQTGTGQDSRVPVSMDYFHLWTFRGEKVIRIDSFLREEPAREAAGLSR